MSLDDKLQALQDDPGPEQAADALREIVHDLNNLLGSIVLETDTLERLAAVLDKLSEQEGDPRLAKGAKILADARGTIDRSVDSIEALLRRVSEAASELPTGDERPR